MNTGTKYQALQDELELRYGPALAQDIVDQIKKAEEPAFVPGYVGVKAASEVLELFRREAKGAVHDLKEYRLSAAPDITDVLDLESARRHQQCKRALDLYFLAQSGFYRLYHKAFAAYIEEAPATRKYRKAHEPESACVSAAA